MLPSALDERLDALIDDLIMDGGVEAASMASIMLAARDSVKRDSLVTLSRRVWAVSNELSDGLGDDSGPASASEDEPADPLSLRPVRP